MRKFKKFASKVVAFTMATALTFSGALDNFALSRLNRNVSGLVETQAATTGTVNADRFTWDNALVYFLLTDRFQNGNPDNDHSYNRGLDKNGNKINISDERATFHGGDFAGITQKIEEGYFNDLGVNAIWLSAPYEQIHGYIVGGDGSPSFAHYSYHGYYVLDYTQTDANFGTAEEFKTLVDTAHEHGIRIIMDIVLNHAGYNSLYDMNEYDFGVVKDGWDDYYYSMANVNNKDYHSYIDYEADSSQWLKWWGDWIRAGLPGYTEGGSDPYTSSLAGLPDFKTESKNEVGIPAFLEKKWKQEGRYDEEVAELKSFLSSNGYAMTVTNCISYWLSTWVREYGVDGFRCDTAKHVENASWAVLEEMCTKALKEWKANNPDKKLDDLDFWMTGEAWDHGVGYDAYYSVGKFDSMINFDTWGAGVLASGVVNGKYSDYAGAVNTKDDFNILSFMSSHDSVITRGDQVYLGSAFLLLPGGVQIYYGDETNRGMAEGVPDDGNGGAGHSLRSDMNWDSIDQTVLAHWQKVGTFRSSHVAVGAGAHIIADASDGVGFVRTYEKGDVKDRIAAVIGASYNTEVTLDVSAAWKDGDTVVNYYDSSAAVVTDGKVTFNSGATGTILIADPDGKPLVTVAGAAKFKDSQTVKVSLKDADYAIISIDGGNKRKVVDGDTFEIGPTAYEGDTISIEYKATNEKGTSKGKAAFYKAYKDEDIEDKKEEVVKVKGKIKYKVSDGSTPYIYCWKDKTKEYTSAWPGDKITEKDADGYFVFDVDTTDKYNVLFHNGGAGKTADITGLMGEVKIDIDASYGKYTVEGSSIPEEENDNIVIVRVKQHPNNSSGPNLYAWSGDKTLNGGFPGNVLTQKDENGNYYIEFKGVSTVNCIVSGGSNQNQSDNIGGISGEALITVNTPDYKDITVEKTAKPESKFEAMKKEARQTKILTPSDYTSATWDAFVALEPAAAALIAKGEKEADPAEVESMYAKLAAAKAALKLVAPKVTNSAVGSSVITGKAVSDSVVTVVYNGNTYTATADEVTGEWKANVSGSLASGKTFTVKAERNGLASSAETKNVGGGEVIVEELKVSLSVSATNVNVGDTVTLNATATGGSGDYKYTFMVEDDRATTPETLLKDSSKSTATWTATEKATKYMVVVVEDSEGSIATAEKKVTVNEVVEVDELKVSLSGVKSTYKVGDKLTATATATGGTGEYKYLFEIADSKLENFKTIGESSKNSASWTVNTTDIGTAGYVFVAVFDSEGNEVSTSKSFKIEEVIEEEELSVSLKLSASSISPKETVTMTATAAGGAGGYKYTYKVGNKALTSVITLKSDTTASKYTWKSSEAGTRKLVVVVEDKEGNTATASQQLTIKKATNLTATIKLSSTTIAPKESVTITASATGGSGGYKYTYKVANTAYTKFVTISTGSSKTASWKSSEAGMRYLVVTVTDSQGNTATAKQLLTIQKDSDLAVSLKLSSATVAAKGKVTMTATATGGSGSYTYSYKVANKSLTSIVDLTTTDAKSYTWKTSAAGNRMLIVTVTDSQGNTATAQQALTITI